MKLSEKEATWKKELPLKQSRVLSNGTKKKPVLCIANCCSCENLFLSEYCFFFFVRTISSYEKYDEFMHETI